MKFRFRYWYILHVAVNYFLHFRNTHQHILGLLGYCESSSFQCIVYPYMTNGSLDKCLCYSEKRKFLTAKRRTTIATESAEGICHLHSLDLVHRDLKRQVLTEAVPLMHLVLYGQLSLRKL